jgi:hypothetical protein
MSRGLAGVYSMKLKTIFKINFRILARRCREAGTGEQTTGIVDRSLAVQYNNTAR